MKTLSLIFLIAFPTAFVQSDLKSSGLKGKVKKETRYTFMSNEIDFALPRNWAYKSEAHFNEQGNIIRNVFFNDFRTGRVAAEMNYAFDAEGRKIKTTEKGGRVISSSVFSKDNKGRLKETVSSGTGVSFEFVYNSLGKRYTAYNYDRSGKLNVKKVYRYDRRGNLLETISYKPGGQLEGKTQYRYDKQNNKTEEIYFKLNKVQGKRTNKYDKYGNVIREIDSSLVNVGGPPGIKIGSQMNSRSYKYTHFDKYGNWLEQQLLLKDKIARRIRREIEYFE